MKIFRRFAAGLGALALTLSISLAFSVAVAPAAQAAGGAKQSHAPKDGWPFAGPVGRLDTDSVQRGYQVYREVCASCHGMEKLSYRNLGEKGGPFYSSDYPNANNNPLVKAFAAEDEILDPVPNDVGDYIYRPARSSDPFRSPYPNKQAASAANNGAFPPDLSVITKARGSGADGSGASYVYSLLTGYPDAEAFLTKPGADGLTVTYLEFDDEALQGELTQTAGQYYNPYMPGDSSSQWQGDPRHAPYGGFLAMAPPLSDGRVEYIDGTEATVEQMAYDVAQFLQWAGDPKQEQRKALGLPVILYLTFLAILLWFSFHRIWRKVEH